MEKKYLQTLSFTFSLWWNFQNFHAAFLCLILDQREKFKFYQYLSQSLKIWTIEKDWWVFCRFLLFFLFSFQFLQWVFQILYKSLETKVNFACYFSINQLSLIALFHTCFTLSQIKFKANQFHIEHHLHLWILTNLKKAFKFWTFQDLLCSFSLS